MAWETMPIICFIEQEDLIISFILYVRSIQSMVKQCQFNEYHKACIHDLYASVLYLCSRQSIVISTIVSPTSISTEEFTRRLSDLQEAIEILRSASRKARLNRVNYALESETTIQSEGQLAHVFFLFQFDAIARFIIQATTVKGKKSKTKKKKSFKERFTPTWSRLFSAIKSMLIIGVGSIFVMVPRLALTFENGQWILIALCMTQGDSVGGAFTTMRMRLVGTLLGS
jgi:hypothetical protein